MRYVSSSGHPLDRRPGVVLLVVMAMLALFASLALSFVFYADAEAIAARLSMDSMVRLQADVDPETLAGSLLAQLLYPTENTNSALRGWDMARGVYGYLPTALNYTPFNSSDRWTAAERRQQRARCRSLPCSIRTSKFAADADQLSGLLRSECSRGDTDDQYHPNAGVFRQVSLLRRGAAAASAVVEPGERTGKDPARHSLPIITMSAVKIRGGRARRTRTASYWRKSCPTEP